jgi:hypothetical protein
LFGVDCLAVVSIHAPLRRMIWRNEMRIATGGTALEQDVDDGQIAVAEQWLEVWRNWSRVGRPGPKRLKGICLVGGSSRPEFSASDEAIASAVDVVIAGMPDESAWLIKARYLWGWTDVTIAQHMQCFRHTAKARREKALRVLAKKVAERKAA